MDVFNGTSPNPLLLLKERIIKVETLLDKYAALTGKYNNLEKTLCQVIESEKRAKKDAARYLEKYCRLSKKCDGLVNRIKYFEDSLKYKTNELEQFKNEFERVNLLLQMYKTERNVLKNFTEKRNFLVSSLWKILKESDANKYKNMITMFFKLFQKDLEDLKLEGFRNYERSKVSKMETSKSVEGQESKAESPSPDFNDAEWDCEETHQLPLPSLNAASQDLSECAHDAVCLNLETEPHKPIVNSCERHWPSEKNVASINYSENSPNKVYINCNNAKLHSALDECSLSENLIEQMPVESFHDLKKCHSNGTEWKPEWDHIRDEILNGSVEKNVNPLENKKNSNLDIGSEDFKEEELIFGSSKEVSSNFGCHVKKGVLDNEKNIDFEFVLNKSTLKKYPSKTKTGSPQVPAYPQKYDNVATNDIHYASNSSETIALDMNVDFGRLEILPNVENSQKIDDGARTVSFKDDAKDQENIFFQVEKPELKKSDNNRTEIDPKKTPNRSIFDVTTDDVLKCQKSTADNKMNEDTGDLKAKDLKITKAQNLKDNVPQNSGEENKTFRSDRIKEQDVALNGHVDNKRASSVKADITLHPTMFGNGENNTTLELRCSNYSECSADVSDTQVYRVLKTFARFRLLSPIKDNEPKKTKLSEKEGPKNNISSKNSIDDHLPIAVKNNLFETVVSDSKCDKDNQKQKQCHRDESNYLINNTYKKLPVGTADKCIQTNLKSNSKPVKKNFSNEALIKPKKLVAISRKDIKKICKHIWNRYLKRRINNFNFYTKLLRYDWHCFDLMALLLRVMRRWKWLSVKMRKKTFDYSLKAAKHHSFKNKNQCQKRSSWIVEDVQKTTNEDNSSTQGMSVSNILEGNRIIYKSKTEKQPFDKSFEGIESTKKFGFFAPKLTEFGESDMYEKNYYIKGLMCGLKLYRCSSDIVVDDFKKEVENFTNQESGLLVNSHLWNDHNLFGKSGSSRFIHNRSENTLEPKSSVFNESNVLKIEINDVEKSECSEGKKIDSCDEDICKEIEVFQSVTINSEILSENKLEKLEELSNVSSRRYNAESISKSNCENVLDCLNNEFQTTPTTVDGDSYLAKKTQSTWNEVDPHENLRRKCELLFGEADVHCEGYRVEKLSKSTSLFEERDPVVLSPGNRKSESEITDNQSDSDNEREDINFSRKNPSNISPNSKEFYFNSSSTNWSLQANENESINRETNSLSLKSKVQNDNKSEEMPECKKPRLCIKSELVQKPVFVTRRSLRMSTRKKNNTSCMESKGAAGDVNRPSENCDILNSIMDAMTKQTEEFKPKRPMLSPVLAQPLQYFTPPVSDSVNLDQHSTLPESQVMNHFREDFLSPSKFSLTKRSGKDCKKRNSTKLNDDDANSVSKDKLKNVVEKEIRKFLRVKINTSQEAEENLKPCIAALEHCDEDLIAQVVVAEILANVDETLQEFERPAPPLTQTQHRIMSILAVLTSSNAKFQSISLKILKVIQSKIFPETFFWPDDSLEMASRFYTALCRRLNNFKGIWKFCFKAITSMRQRWCIPVFSVLQVWPDILHNSTDIKENLLVNAFVNIILQTPKVEYKRRKHQEEKLLALKHLLIHFYNFEVSHTMETFTEKLFDHFFEDVPGALDALVLISKCRNWDWTRKKIIDRLSKIISDWPTNNVSDVIGKRTLQIFHDIRFIIPSVEHPSASPIADVISGLCNLLCSKCLDGYWENKAVNLLYALRQHCDKNVLLYLLQIVSPNKHLYKCITNAMNELNRKANGTNAYTGKVSLKTTKVKCTKYTVKNKKQIKRKTKKKKKKKNTTARSAKEMKLGEQIFL